MFTVKIEAPPEIPALLERLSGAEQLQASSVAATKLAAALPGLLQARSEETGPAGPFSQGWTAAPTAATEVTIHNDMPVSKFVEQPTRPHRIVPKDPNGWLVFPWAKFGGKIFFFKAVNHPGTLGKLVFQYVMAEQGGALAQSALIDEALEYFNIGS